MRTKQAVRALFAAVALTLLAVFAGTAFAGSDQTGQGKDSVDCKTSPNDARCRGAK